jgi:hypothetical protein
MCGHRQRVARIRPIAAIKGVARSWAAWARKLAARNYRIKIVVSGPRHAGGHTTTPAFSQIR